MANLAKLLLLLGLAGAAYGSTVCQTYTIKGGDSPYSIAQTFNILPDNLAVALGEQNLDPATLQPGQVIYLYPYYGACQYVTSAGGDQSCQAYLVQTGDTLTGIASAFNIYVGDLQDTNPSLSTNGTGLKPGTYIKLPPWKWACPEPGNQKPCQVYTASAGDSLASIASMFQVTVDQLITVNKDTSLDTTTVLKPNQPVKIYPYYDSCPDGGIPAVPPVTKNTACRAYIVQRGDSLSSIARLFGLATTDLVSANPELADPSLLQPGKEVKLPPYPDSCGQSIIVSADNVTPSSDASVSTSSIDMTELTPIKKVDSVNKDGEMQVTTTGNKKAKKHPGKKHPAKKGGKKAADTEEAKKPKKDSDTAAEDTTEPAKADDSKAKAGAAAAKKGSKKHPAKKGGKKAANNDNTSKPKKPAGEDTTKPAGKGKQPGKKPAGKDKSPKHTTPKPKGKGKGPKATKIRGDEAMPPVVDPTTDNVAIQSITDTVSSAVNTVANAANNAYAAASNAADSAVTTVAAAVDSTVAAVTGGTNKPAAAAAEEAASAPAPAAPRRALAPAAGPKMAAVAPATAPAAAEAPAMALEEPTASEASIAQSSTSAGSSVGPSATLLALIAALFALL